MATVIPWDVIQARHDELNTQLADPYLDREKRQHLQREASHLDTILEHHRAMVDLEKSIEQTQQMAAQEKDPEMAELYTSELEELRQQYAARTRELDMIMAPRDEHDDRSVYLEIRAGTGGQEAALFVGDLTKMYTNYALKKGWRVSVESASATDLGGYREVVLFIQGKDVYGYLKYESGVHRVQRVPATETQGRVHTSTATVAVLPEAKEVEVNINPADLRIDVYRSGGAGGQHVNTTDSAVRITHIPTGVVVTCQDERSQLKNKNKAMKVLQSRLLAHQVEKQAAEMSLARKEQVGSGTRAEKARTYNYPQNRITDHQADITLKKLDIVMQGNLDEIIEALQEREYEKRKEDFLRQFKK